MHSRRRDIVHTMSRMLCCITLALLSISLSSAWGQEYIPDHKRTPGAINPSVTKENIMRTACVAGWTATIRPPSSYTRRLKLQQIHEQGLRGRPAEYHEDHLVPLCVGGHPSDQRNLWPQPIRGRWTDKIKDQLESSVCRAVCRGDMTLTAGQALFLAPDWTKSYVKFFQLN